MPRLRAQGYGEGGVVVRTCPACGQTFYGSAAYVDHIHTAHTKRKSGDPATSIEPIRSRVSPSEISEYQRYPATGITRAVRDALANGPLALDELVAKDGKSRASDKTGLNRLERKGLLVRTPLYGSGHKGRPGMQKKVYRLKPRVINQIAI